jgi:hypothetical protein
MNKVLRVALPGYNAQTDTNPDHFALYSDEDWVLIKELKRGADDVELNNIATIPHNLGYIPLYFVYCEVGNNVYKIVNGFDPVGGGWRCYADDTNIYIANYFSATYKSYRYYIFYDNITSGSKTINESKMVLKVAKNGISAFSKDPNDFIFHSDLNTFKILKEGNLNNQTVDADPKTFTVAHDQSYIPGVYAFAKFDDGYIALPDQTNESFIDKSSATFANKYWQVRVDATNINFIFYKGLTDNYAVSIKYYVFEIPGT